MLQVLFLLLVSLKVAYSFANAWLTLKVIKPENSVVSDFDDKQLRRRIVNHSYMVFLEIVIICVLATASLTASETDARYIYIGLLVMCTAYVMDDLVAILNYRREQKRRKRSS